MYRPHAFALGFGDNGATVAFGQLLWRYDVLTFDLGSLRDTVDGVGQEALRGFVTEIPTIDASDGDPMDPMINNNNRYHQLTGYGDVYLYWTVDLDASTESFIPACWVQVGGDLAEDTLDVVGIDATDHSRVAGVNATAGQLAGRYRVKLGTVNEDDPITQNHSSDVFWSIVLFSRNVDG